MQPWDLISRQLSIDDLVVDVNSVEMALTVCRLYLAKADAQHPKSMRERHVIFLLNEMRERGKITESDPRYRPINDFYLEHFEERFPSYVERQVALKRA